MLSRWYHRPYLHSPAHGLEKKASWMELFFDLIFVAAFIQLGNFLSESISLDRFLAFAGVFVPLWVSWTGFTFYSNRFTVDDFTHRTCVFIQMFAVGGMAISAQPAVLQGRVLPFAIAAAVAQSMVALMYLRTYRQVAEGREYSRYWGIVFGVAGMLWLASAFMPRMVAIGFWIGATAVVLAAPLSKQSRLLSDRHPLDFEHLGERYGLLTLIVLGESFVKVLSALVAEEAGLDLYLQAGVTLLVTGGVWWVYFDDVAGAHVRKGPGQWMVWLYSHIPLQMSIIALGVAVKKAVHFTWDAPAGDAYRWLLAGTLAMVYLSVAAIDSVTERRQAELSDRARVNARALSGLLLLLLAPAGSTMSGGMFLTLVIAINVGHVVFDLMMAPLEASAHAELGKKTTADIARQHVAAGQKTSPVALRDASKVVRKGTPSELRSDLYFYFMHGSWLRLLAAFAFLFLASNVFFAALYTLEPDAIANARPRSFADAFYFSVQTMSTIGFGSLSPATEYGNVVVTIEAAFGIVAVAIATGVVFAKLSRPQSSALFSRPAIIFEMDGEKTLMFRVGNARGNDVVDASITVTVLKDEISREGHHLRRLYDLDLVRSRSPLFLMSWSVMHVIDDESPLRDVDWDRPEESIGSMTATLVGHDGTYGQTVYARHTYHAHDFQTDVRFVDIIHELEDGRLMIDYGAFHDTEPMGPTSD